MVCHAHDTYRADVACVRYKDAWRAGKYEIQVGYDERLCSSCSRCLGLLGRSDSRVDLLAILPPDTRRGRTVAAALTGADTDDWWKEMRLGLEVQVDTHTVRVDSARHAVRDFDVELGDNVLCKYEYTA